MGAIQQYGGAQPGDRTMLDALAPALVAYKAALTTGVVIEHVWRHCNVWELRLGSAMTMMIKIVPFCYSHSIAA